jgi:hypothetical protein
MYTTAVLVDVMPLKYALGGKVRISSVPANSGIERLVVVRTVALFTASLAEVPTPINTVTDPELSTRY